MNTKGVPAFIESEQYGRKKKMPVNRKKMKNLKEEYGTKKGKNVYYALETKAKQKTKAKKSK
jgi:hypothetical protein